MNGGCELIFHLNELESFNEFQLPRCIFDEFRLTQWVRMRDGKEQGDFYVAVTIPVFFARAAVTSWSDPEACWGFIGVASTVTLANAAALAYHQTTPDRRFNPLRYFHQLKPVHMPFISLYIVAFSVAYDGLLSR
mmetsp:Transcript_26086/g.56513  ORF Transcript_26086/g.56513 Transcript_26086/m.56513 type:complete len:135 (+) Transcript_26086:260-664(+)